MKNYCTFCHQETDWSISDPEVIDGPVVEKIDGIVAMEIRAAIECNCCGQPFEHVFQVVEDIPERITSCHLGESHVLEAIVRSASGIYEVGEKKGTIGAAIQLKIQCSCGVSSGTLSFEARKSFQIEESEEDPNGID